MVAFISNHASMRWGFLYVLFLFCTTIPIIGKFVSLKEGLRQAGKLVDPNATNRNMTEAERRVSQQPAHIHAAGVSSVSNIKASDSCDSSTRSSRNSSAPNSEKNSDTEPEANTGNFTTQKTEKALQKSGKV